MNDQQLQYNHVKNLPTRISRDVCMYIHELISYEYHDIIILQTTNLPDEYT